MRAFAGGEVKEFSDMYNHTRHLALERLEREAAERGANAVVDIQTQIIALGAGAKEMLMVGTASHHPLYGQRERPVDLRTDRRGTLEPHAAWATGRCGCCWARRCTPWASRADRGLLPRTGAGRSQLADATDL